LSSKSKLYGGKKTVIPVAQIEYVKSPKSSKIRGEIQKNRESASESVLRKKKAPISGDRNSKQSGRKPDSDGGKVTITAKLKTKRISKTIVKGAEKEKRASKRTVKEVEDLICPFDSLVFLGDLNYRLELPRLEVTACTFLLCLFNDIFGVIKCDSSRIFDTPSYVRYCSVDTSIFYVLISLIFYYLRSNCSKILSVMMTSPLNVRKCSVSMPVTIMDVL
jgi:hypothetical protein